MAPIPKNGTVAVTGAAGAPPPPPLAPQGLCLPPLASHPTPDPAAVLARLHRQLGGEAAPRRRLQRQGLRARRHRPRQDRLPPCVPRHSHPASSLLCQSSGLCQPTPPPADAAADLLLAGRMPGYATGRLTIHSCDLSEEGVFDDVFPGCHVRRAPPPPHTPSVHPVLTLSRQRADVETHPHPTPIPSICCG